MGADPVIATPADRRYRRRQETIEEILARAVEIMAEEGVGGLTLGEVARRMGVRPPSLYGYFPSKEAVYDAVFARGAREVTAVVVDGGAALLADLRPGRSLEDVMRRAARTFVRWAVEHPVYTQLLYWRPVPGFQPSPEAFAPAAEMWRVMRAQLGRLQEIGLIRADADIGDVQQDWASIVTGVITRQLANAPHEGFDDGHLTSRLDDLVAMFSRYYCSPSTPKRGSRRVGRR